MRIKDETVRLPFDVSIEDLEKVEQATGAKISTSSDIIIIEGDDAEVDEAAAMIAQLPKIEINEADLRFENDPFASLEKGQRYSTQLTYLPEEYSVYDLISFNEDTGKWHCRKTTYHKPYKHMPVDHSYEDVSPEDLIDKNKMRLVKRRK